MSNEPSLAELQILRRKYTYTPHSGLYDSMFTQERNRIRSVLPDVTIEHVGSTAVPNLGGKPVVDILIQTEDTIAAKEALVDIGYEYRDTASTADRMFMKVSIDGKLYHMHVCKPDSEEARKMLAFRDYLLTHEDIRKEYDEAKREASAAAIRCYAPRAMKEMYMQVKQPVIDKILQQISPASASV